MRLFQLAGGRPDQPVEANNLEDVLILYGGGAPQPAGKGGGGGRGERFRRAAISGNGFKAYCGHTGLTGGGGEGGARMRLREFTSLLEDRGLVPEFVSKSKAVGAYNSAVDNAGGYLAAKPQTPNPKHYALSLKALTPQPSTLNPQPSTLNPQTSTLNPQPSTLNPQP